MVKTVVLSQRLTAIAGLVARGARVVDIGADHALVPIYLLQTAIAKLVIAVDVNSGPLEAARENVCKFDLGSFIDVRKSDGFAEIQAGEVDTAIIAGMGGAQIIKILDAGIKIVDQLNCLILQPQDSAATIREWLADNGWEIVDERLIEEIEIVYEIIKAVNTPVKNDLLGSFAKLMLPYEVGPVLFCKRDALLPKLIAAEISRIERIIVEMNKAKLPDKKKITELTVKKIELSGVLDSLR